MANEYHFHQREVNAAKTNQLSRVQHHSTGSNLPEMDELDRVIERQSKTQETKVGYHEEDVQRFRNQHPQDTQRHVQEMLVMLQPRQEPVRSDLILAVEVKLSFALQETLDIIVDESIAQFQLHLNSEYAPEQLNDDRATHWKHVETPHASILPMPMLATATGLQDNHWHYLTAHIHLCYYDMLE